MPSGSTATIRPAGVASAATLALLIVATGCSRDEPAATANPAAGARDTPAVAGHPTTDARLSLVNNNGRVRYDGAVDSDASRQRVVDAMTQAFGSAATGHVEVDPAVRPPTWLDGLQAFATAFDRPGAAVTFDGDTIELAGQVSREDRARLLEQARQSFPDHAHTGLLQGTDDAPPATGALAQLPPGADASTLADALNTVAIEFEPGSARIAPGSLDSAGRIADAIKASASGTRLLVSGGGDGDAGLSRQRAEALKVQLILNGVSPALIDTDGSGAAGPIRFSPAT